MKYWSAVDVAWAFGIGLVALGGTIGRSIFHQRSLLALALVLLWSIRLGLHLFLRIKKYFPHEDRRYEALKESWKNHLKLKTFVFFQFQAMTQVVLLLPLLCIFLEPSQEFRVTDILGVTIIVAGLVGEFIADRQLFKFKQDPRYKNNVCDRGLWRYSRHPNYFFEWIVWVGFAVLAVLSPHGATAVLAPVMMYILLVYVTGVKPTEQQSLRSKGKNYEEYRKRTHAFFPWRPKINGCGEGV